MRVFFLPLLIAACSASTDPCDDFPQRTCITLEVRGPQQVDQIHVTSLELQIDEASPPAANAPFGLPVQLAVLPDPEFAGPFALDVRGLNITSVVGQRRLDAVFVRHEHRRLVADLALAGADLSTVTADLSGADLRPSGADLSAVPGAPHWVAQATGNSQQLARIWAASSTDLYVSGYHGGILHSTGNGVWTLQTTGVASNVMLSGLWGSGPTDIWAGGGLSPDQVIIHSTGNGTWTAQTVPGVDGIVGVGGIGNQVWASSQGSMLHFTGSNWNKETSGVPATFIGAVFAVAVNAVYACGFQAMLFNTGTLNWSTESLGGVSCNDVWGSGPSDIYATGGAGKMLHSTGIGDWTPQTIALNNAPSAVGGSSSSNIYAGGFGGAIFHSTGNGSWTPEAVDMTVNQITSIFVLPNGDAWATTDEGPGVVLHRVTTP